MSIQAAAAAISKMDLTTRRRWRRMEPERRARVAELYNRHIDACTKLEVLPERTFITETMNDLARGIEFDD